jgi:NAD-dependent deacetylase
MPAGGLVHLAHAAGAKVVEINPEATAVSDTVDLVLRGKSGEILPQLLPGGPLRPTCFASPAP